jgi:hypothetical protein
LPKERVLRERLAIVIPPGGEILVCVRLGVPRNVGRGREILWVAADVDRVRGLVDPDPVDEHRCRERQVVDVNKPEILGHAQVDDDVLIGRKGEI